MTLARLTLVAASALALLAPPAVAQKSDDEPGPLKTGVATATSPGGPGTFTALAQCPGKTKVVGGGFALPGPSTVDIMYPLESRREGKNAWRVTAYRADTGGAGPALTFTAEAYCRSGLGKVGERSDIQGNGGAFATCGPGRTALGGGFSHGGPSQDNQISAFLYGNLMVGKVGWVMRAFQTSAITFTSYVYCQRKGEKAPKLVSGAGTTGTTALSVGSADTAPCPGKRDAFAGGFEISPPGFAGPVVGLIVESRRSGEGWHVAAARLAATGNSQIAIAAYGYCS